MSKKTSRNKHKEPSQPREEIAQASHGPKRTWWAGLYKWVTSYYFWLAAGGLGLQVLLFVLVIRPWLLKPNLPEQDDDSIPPKLNDPTPPGPAPAGMVWIPGGEFYMGFRYDDDERFPEIRNFHERFADCFPLRKVYVDGFWMDKTEVTNVQFAAFVKATGYVTEAEKPINPQEHPDAAKEYHGKAGSIVFVRPPPDMPITGEPKEVYKWFKFVVGANWKHPEGPDSDLKGRDNHPVTHISWNDAFAYCKWAKKRLPTEAEWEIAARGSLDRNKYAWGDEFLPSGKWQLNIWQGPFPYQDQGLDGFKGTAPVGTFPPNGYGLVDMAGNVWEWCADWYQRSYYADSPDRNPKGPSSGFDPLEPGIPKRVQRGGSFLCSDNYCNRYLPAARSMGEPGSSANHTGFRCVKSRE